MENSVSRPTASVVLSATVSNPMATTSNNTSTSQPKAPAPPRKLLDSDFKSKVEAAVECTRARRARVLLANAVAFLVIAMTVLLMVAMILLLFVAITSEDPLKAEHLAEQTRREVSEGLQNIGCLLPRVFYPDVYSKLRDKGLCPEGRTLREWAFGGT